MIIIIIIVVIISGIGIIVPAFVTIVVVIIRIIVHIVITLLVVIIFVTCVWGLSTRITGIGLIAIAWSYAPEMRLHFLGWQPRDALVWVAKQRQRF